MPEGITTFIAVVGAITGTISLCWRILDERNRFDVIINKLMVTEEEDATYFNVDFDVLNLSKKPTSIRDVQLHIPRYKIRLAPDENVNVHDFSEPIGMFRPIFDLPVGKTVNKHLTFVLKRKLEIVGKDDLYLVVTDTYGKTVKKKIK
jgi:hypothetical protein